MTKQEERVLAYVNRLRGKLAAPPLKHLPRGIPQEADSCPIARALPGNAEVDEAETVVWGEDYYARQTFKNPQYVSRFVIDFDRGKLPHLIVASKRSAFV